MIKIDDESLSYLMSDDKDELILFTQAKESLGMKVKICSAFLKMLQSIREEGNSILKLNGLCPGSKIPKGIIYQGIEGLKSGFDRFSLTKDQDSINEIRPELTEKDIDKYWKPIHL